MIIIELKLRCLVCIRNASSYSMYNTIERNVLGINFRIQKLACNRLESTRKVEESIKSVKRIKIFVDNNIDNTKLMSKYMDSVQPIINRMNNTI